MMEPSFRLRRLRRTPALRALARTTRLSPENFISPHFVVSGTNVRQNVDSMPGVARVSPDLLLEEARALRDLGIRTLLLFGLPETKDAKGSGAWDEKGPVPTALRLLREADLDMALIADVCMCEYTDHGHCGVIANGTVDNDATLPLLSQAALAYAKAGADIVAPSDMMDGRVAAIRDALDEKKFTDTAILSYAAKFA